LFSSAAFFPENNLFLSRDPESSRNDVGCFCGDLAIMFSLFLLALGVTYRINPSFSLGLTILDVKSFLNFLN
jgi:hypothetical protein